MKVLPFTALSDGGSAVHMSFRLHDQVIDPDRVGKLASALLETISEEVTGVDVDPMGNGDVLQALALAMAVRARIIDAPPETIRKVVDSLVADAMDAAAAGRTMPGGRS